MSEASWPPKRLFLQWGNPGETPQSVDASDVAWAGSRVFPGDVEYVRADLAAAATARAEKAERSLREIVEHHRAVGNYPMAYTIALRAEGEAADVGE